MRFFIKAVTMTFLMSVTAQAKDFISLAAVGDIMMGTTYPANALPENQGKDLFKPALQWLQASDIRFGNFEGTFFDGSPQGDGKAGGPNRFLFRTPTDMVQRLNEAGINVVSLANNHVKDFGQAGVASTKSTLRSAGIQFSSKAGEVAEFQIEETSVALIAADFYKAPRSITEPASLYQEISQLKAKGKLVVVSAHVGAEGSGAEIIKTGTEIFLGENRGDSIVFAHGAIDAGADVIIMHGPHVPRGIELYQGRLVIYSLGNFMTGKGIMIDGISKLAPLIRIQIKKNGEFHQGQIVSFLQKREPQRIELDPQAQALKLIRNLSAQQFPNSVLTFEDNGTFRAR